MKPKTKAQELGLLSRDYAVAKDKKNWLALFDKDAIVQDPIGKSPLDPEGHGHQGIEAIEKFYDTVIANGNIEFNILDATQFSSAAPSKADIVFTSNFLEHLPSKKKLDSFLTDVFITLKPGGKYIILGPNIRYVPHMYWDYYDHHIPLSHLSLCEALRLRGFKIQLCIKRWSLGALWSVK